MEKFNEKSLKKLRKNGHRLTKQRCLILEELRKVDTHPSADEVFYLVRKKMPHISVGTVYRNLNMLEELGLIIELDYGRGCARFDGRCDSHYHFVCKKCGRIVDIDEPVEDELNKLVSKKTGLRVLKHRLEFYGYCWDCKKKKR